MTTTRTLLSDNGTTRTFEVWEGGNRLGTDEETTLSPKQVNTATLIERAQDALTANANDLAQDAQIITQASVLMATSGTRTTAQLTGDVRALAQACLALANHDANAKREINALIRFTLDRVVDISDTV